MKFLMRSLLERLDGHWFKEIPAARLAVVRILVGVFALQYLGARFSLLGNIAASSPDLFAPVGLAAFLTGPMPAMAFQFLVLLTLLLNVAFIAGWRHRLTGPSFAVLLLFVLCYRNSWSMIYHSDNALVLHALVLGLTRSADALSLDSLAARARGRARSVLQSGWPIRLLCVLTALIYFLAGIAKVAGPLSWSWMAGESMRAQMAIDGLRKELLGGGASPLAFMLYEKLWFFSAIGIGTFVLELGAPFALLHERLSRYWAVGVWLMHWGILLIMDIKFEYSLSGIIFAGFFPVELAVERLKLAYAAFRKVRSTEQSSAASAAD